MPHWDRALLCREIVCGGRFFVSQVIDKRGNEGGEGASLHAGLRRTRTETFCAGLGPGHNYVEVPGIVDPDLLSWGWMKFVEKFESAHIVCFGCQNADTVEQRASAADIKNSGVIKLQRDVGTEKGFRPHSATASISIRRYRRKD